MLSRRTACGLLLSLAVFPLPLAAVTTVEVEVGCPVCHTKNKFYDYASWGSYIYAFPSKFQLIFFPYTYSSTIYCCKKCRLSLYMWDFKDLPKEKIADVAKLLEPVKISGEFKTYTDIPASDRMLVAEKVYQLLGRDDSFWNHFYRVLGYYCARDRKNEEASNARHRALDIVQKMLQDSANAGKRKELLVISGSMRHFTGDDPEAKKELNEASSLKFADERIGEERSKNYDEYLSSLIKEFISAIDAGKVPADLGSRE